MSAANDTVRARRSWLARNSESPSRLKVVGDVPPDLANSADENGSLVTVDPVDWIICFVPGLQRQWWHRFVHHKHKHVFAMRPTNTGSWLLVEPWWTRMMVTILPPADAVKFLRWGGTGDILRVREAVPGKASQLRGWSNCAVLTAFVLGRPSWTWTPHGLYRELLREKTTRRENVRATSRRPVRQSRQPVLVQCTECQCRPAFPAAQGIAHHHWTQSSRDDDDTVLAGGLLHSHPRSGPLPGCDTGLRATWP